MCTTITIVNIVFYMYANLAFDIKDITPIPFYYMLPALLNKYKSFNLKKKKKIL